MSTSIEIYTISGYAFLLMLFDCWYHCLEASVSPSLLFSESEHWPIGNRLMGRSGHAFLLLVTSVPLLFSLCLRYLYLNYFQFNESEPWLIGNCLMCRGGQAAMEVLRQADAGKSNIKRIKRLYRMLQRKQLNQVRDSLIRN